MTLRRILRWLVNLLRGYDQGFRDGIATVAEVRQSAYRMGVMDGAASVLADEQAKAKPLQFPAIDPNH